MYKLINRVFTVTDISTLKTESYDGMRECNRATGITMYKLKQIAEDLEEKDWYVTNKHGMYKVSCSLDVKDPLIIAYPVIPDLFAPIKFRSVTKLKEQFGVGKSTIYDRWEKAYPVYEDNPTELIVKYWQNNTPVKCKEGNAYGEEFTLRFFKEYPKGDVDAFERYKGYGKGTKGYI